VKYLRLPVNEQKVQVSDTTMLIKAENAGYKKEKKL